MLLKSLPFEHVARPPGAKSNSPAPMLLMLHGIGSHERDLFNLSSEIDPRFHVLSLRGPYALGQGSYGWFETEFAVDGSRIRPESAEASRVKLGQFIEQAAKHYGTDPARCYLLGFSQGAVLALLTALTSPETIAGLVALSGRLPGELLATSSPIVRQLAGREAIAGFPVFLAHGTQDTVIKVEEGQHVRDRFMALQADVIYREYDSGHTIPPQCVSDMGVWLSARLITRV
jgi:phospholipase/carboxylesterase